VTFLSTQKIKDFFFQFQFSFFDKKKVRFKFKNPRLSFHLVLKRRICLKIKKDFFLIKKKIKSSFRELLISFSFLF